MCEVYVVDEEVLLQRTSPPSANRNRGRLHRYKNVEIYVEGAFENSDFFYFLGNMKCIMGGT